MLVSMDWTEREMVKQRLVNRYRVLVVQDEKVLEICYVPQGPNIAAGMPRLSHSLLRYNLYVINCIHLENAAQ